MPIVIKELSIKVKIEEGKNNSQSSQGINKLQLEAMKSTLIRECTDKVLEKIKEREER